MVLGKGWVVGFCKRKEGVDVEWMWVGVGFVVVEYLLPLFDTPYFLSELCVSVAWGGCQRIFRLGSFSWCNFIPFFLGRAVVFGFVLFVLFWRRVLGWLMIFFLLGLLGSVGNDGLGMKTWVDESLFLLYLGWDLDWVIRIRFGSSFNRRGCYHSFSTACCLSGIRDRRALSAVKLCSRWFSPSLLRCQGPDNPAG